MRALLSSKAWLLGSLILLSTFTALPAQARVRPITSRKADIDPQTIAQLAKDGPLALIETESNGASKQVIMFGLVPASRELVWHAIMSVERYPEFLKSIPSIKVLRRQGPMLEYDWRLKLPVISLSGRRQQRGQMPNLVETRGVSGNLKGSRERWELFEITPKLTLVAFYRTLDVDSGGFLLRSMVKLERSMEAGSLLAMGYVHLQNLTYALAGKQPPAPKGRKGPVPAFRSIPLSQKGIDLKKLSALIRHGQLALIESFKDGSLRQVAILTEVSAPSDKMKKIVASPAKYPEFIPNFAEQKVTAKGSNQLDMQWELEVPLVNLEGRSLMTIEKDGSVDVTAVSGDIKRGRWRWEFHSLGQGKTIPIHYAYSDVRESSWVTRALIEREPSFEHGIVIASGTVALTAMKARAEGRR